MTNSVYVVPREFLKECKIDKVYRHENGSTIHLMADSAIVEPRQGDRVILYIGGWKQIFKTIGIKSSITSSVGVRK